MPTDAGHVERERSNVRDRASTAVVTVASPEHHEHDDDAAPHALARLAEVAPDATVGRGDGGRLRRSRTPGLVVRRLVEGQSDPSGAGTGGATSFEGVPTTLAELLRCNDDNVATLVADPSPSGPLMTLLKGAFEADWFRAKSCLVFDKWPQHSVPGFNHQSSLKLMGALTSLRGEVHKLVMPKAQARVNAELAKRAAGLKGNKKLADQLTFQRGKQAKDQVEYKGSVGADTVTSDVDVSTGGANSEIAVRAYNEVFRETLGTDFDPGTVFDLNVYAMDFIHGKVDAPDKKSYTVNDENPEAPDAADADQRDREQDIWALVHVARFMPDDGEWAAYVQQTVGGIPNAKKKAEQTARLAAARSRAKGFESRLVGMMVHLSETLDFGVKQLETSGWSKEENREYLQGALRMRAANKIYEDKLLQVKELRLEIASLRQSIAKKENGADPQRLKQLVSRLAGELSMAQLYANEVYGTGGGTVHAVMGMQVKKKLSEERGFAVEAKIPPQQWYQTFTDNLGDVLKDFEHYGKAHGGHGADHWYAAFKMGKYADRMVDALPHLAKGGLLTATQAETLESDPDVVALRELARNHVKEKSGASKDDPQKLKDHEYFKTFDGPRLALLRRSALDLGAKVRQMVATASALPADAPPQKAPKKPAAPAPSSGVDSSTVDRTAAAAAIDLALQKMRDAVADTQQEVQDETKDEPSST